ncbi:hypothetical protein [Xenorhabdus entomophaga]|uniref:hypothetical protein n=1 Tax=Xenorhabdus entomophaga TaxID=3136257 RepID=UPI0030F3F380
MRLRLFLCHAYAHPIYGGRGGATARLAGLVFASVIAVAVMAGSSNSVQLTTNQRLEPRWW